MTIGEFVMRFPWENIFYFLLATTIIKSAFNRVMNYFDDKENEKLIERFVDLHSILAFHMEASYETIHKDNILTFSLDGVKPREEDIDKLSHEFVKLTMTLAGPNMMDTFIKLYGTDDNLFFVMMDYFNRRFEDDEIRAQAIENIQDGGDI
jgi:hypothetical protein